MSSARALLGHSLFPLAYTVTTSSLTLIFIGIGIVGDAALAADLALAQGAVIATFLAFSANLRNLILQGSGGMRPGHVLAARLLVLPPLCALSYLLGVHVGAVSASLVGVVLVRRSCEWLAEVDVSVLERENDKRAALRYLVVQAVAPLAVIGVSRFAPGYLLPTMALWAVSPLPLVLARIPHGEHITLASLKGTFKTLLPHAGSTAIVGLAIYLLRLIVVTTAGRTLGGLILTGIAIGSIAGTVFGNVLGPTVALKWSGYAASRSYRFAIAGLIVAGAAALLASFGVGGLTALKPAVFWTAAGLSLVGSAVMIEAHRLRLRMFEERSGDEIFAADVLRSLTLLLLALAIAYLAKAEALSVVYLTDAILSWIFYLSARGHMTGESPADNREQTWIRAAIALLIIVPLFFQLQGTIFYSAEAVADSGGVVSTLPLPFSLLAAFGGVVALGRFRQATLAMATVFAFFVAMVFTTVIASGGLAAYDQRKLLLLIQVILPTFALVLGQTFEPRPGEDRLAASVFLGATLAFAAVQLVLTFVQGRYLITHDFYVFSVYQHRQFVPVIFVGAYLMGLFVFWGRSRRRWPLTMATLVMALYAVHSFSTLGLSLLAAGVVLLAFSNRWRNGTALLVAATAAVSAVALTNLQSTHDFKQKYNLGFEARAPIVSKKLFGSDIKLQEGIAQRLDDWYRYGSGIVESGKTALFGHASPFPREVSTSAHNYYLDFLYNFGLVALLPLLALIAFTLLLLRRHRRAVFGEPALLALALVTLFIVLVDSNFKVTIRQPYPGIFAYFMWGLLLSRLLRLERAERERNRSMLAA